MAHIDGSSASMIRHVTVQQVVGPKMCSVRTARLVSLAPWSTCCAVLWIDSLRIEIVKRRGHWLLSRNGHWYWMIRSVDD